MEYLEQIEQVIVAGTAIVGAFSILAALTPTPKDDHFMRKVVKVVDILGFNTRNATNKFR